MEIDIMSVNTLIRCISTPHTSIPEAAADYKDKNYSSVRTFFKILFTLGLSEAYDHFSNKPAKRESVLELNRALSGQNLGMVEKNMEGEIKCINFRFEGKEYTLRDPSKYCEMQAVPAEPNNQRLQLDVEENGQIKRVSEFPNITSESLVTRVEEKIPMSNGPKYLGY
jgi:hypothetical protein